MTLHQFGPIVPVAVCSALAIAASGWNVWRVKFAYRARGRREVERMLASRGETLVAIEDVPFSRSAGEDRPLTPLDLRGSRPHGRRRRARLQWAYEPRVFPWETEGLKRLAHGIWIPA